MVWADNGYGRMVSRRQGNENPRVPALPEEQLSDFMHGTYYHVSFYDLQAANHITMFPNSMEFVETELNCAYHAGIRQFWLINASNIKPHVYPLDFIANMWQENPLSAAEHRKKYLYTYYGIEPDGQLGHNKQNLSEYYGIEPDGQLGHNKQNLSEYYGIGSDGQAGHKMQDLPAGREMEREQVLGEKSGRQRDLESSHMSPYMQILQEMEGCFRAYAQSTAVFGSHEDERAGEQFVNYVTRHLIHGWMQHGGTKPCESLFWCAKRESFLEQAEWYADVCRKSEQAFSALLLTCSGISEKLKKQGAFSAQTLWEDSMVLQVKLYLYCLRGALYFCRAYEAFGMQPERAQDSLMESFYMIGRAADSYQKADGFMRQREHGRWKGFYANDCLTDVKQTAYMLRQLMGYIRNIGDGPDFYMWQREVVYPEKDRRVVLITNMENHLTDQELYEEMCKRRLERV